MNAEEVIDDRRLVLHPRLHPGIRWLDLSGRDDGEIEMEAVSCRECFWGSDLDDKRVYCYDQDNVHPADDCCHRFKEPKRLEGMAQKVNDAKP